MGIWVIFLAVATAAIGAYVGVACARRSAYAADRRPLWTTLAALVIGGVAFWLTNIVSMAGFAVDGSAVRFDALRVAVSLALCLVATIAGLLIAAPRRRATSSDTVIVTVMAAAAVTGLGLTAGYYVAMTAIEVQGRTYMDGALIAVAGVVAVIASIGVLWMSIADVSRVVLAGGSLAVAVAPVVMHAAMMAALRVRLDASAPTPPGFEVFAILFPAFVVGMLILVVPIVSLLLAPDRVTAELEAQARVWVEQEAAQRRS
ncbi:signaling protein [Rhodococcus sp. NPDC003318]|uniref:signaling protein n=1 Tax=Rhodococcus sp. NPDC003318 TaxID=3364503 RepID=UPI0036C5B0BF